MNHERTNSTCACVDNVVYGHSALFALAPAKEAARRRITMLLNGEQRGHSAPGTLAALRKLERQGVRARLGLLLVAAVRSQTPGPAVTVTPSTI
jgi:hypothetical protein